MLAVAAQGHLRRVDGLHRGDRVALDTGHLDQPANRVAGQPEVVFQTDLGSVLDLRRGGAEAFFLHRMPTAAAASR